MLEKTVLVADDHRDLLELLQFVLETHGYRVLLAQDGFEAVEAVQRRAPDAVVMDLWMPRLDGISATKQIRALHPQLPIIAHTAHTGTLRGVESLFDAICAKPCPTANLVEMLRTLMR